MDRYLTGEKDGQSSNQGGLEVDVHDTPFQGLKDAREARLEEVDASSHLTSNNRQGRA